MPLIGLKNLDLIVKYDKVLYKSCTLLVNIKEIARNLDRPILIIVKYIGFVLDTLSVSDDKRGVHLLIGKYSQHCLSKIINMFIKSYVRCKLCQSIHTYLQSNTVMIRIVCNKCDTESVYIATNKMDHYLCELAKDIVEIHIHSTTIIHTKSYDNLSEIAMTTDIIFK